MSKPYFERGGITIYHGDARDVLPTLEAGSVDLVLTDPPYQSLDVAVTIGSTTHLVSRDQFGGKRLAASDGVMWFTTLSDEDLAIVWIQCRRALASTGALYVFSDVKSGLAIFPALHPNNVIVWDKGQLGMGFSWRRMHEWIAYCPARDHSLRRADLGDIIRCPSATNKVHPTEKPIPVFFPILLNSTDHDDLILDPFLGSGTTLVAAKMLGRRAIGIEIEERYAEIAARRLDQEVLPLVTTPTETATQARLEVIP